MAEITAARLSLTTIATHVQGHVAYALPMCCLSVKATQHEKGDEGDGAAGFIAPRSPLAA